MDPESLASSLLMDQENAGCIADIRVLPSTCASFGNLGHPLPDPISGYLRTTGVTLYSHQCEAIDAIRTGKDILLCTPTASGKTLAFLLPVLEVFAADSGATALFLYPTKALTRDQLGTFSGICERTGIAARPGIYDGDTPREERSAIRARSRIVLTNPHELHYLLGWHHLWSGFFRSLRFVVIDEAHRYRGVFGSHSAFLFRRLRRICRHYGSDPQFVMATATLANPEEFSERLTGRAAQVITRDGSPRGRRHFILYNPFHQGDTGRSPHTESADLLLACLRHGMQTLCFTGSRKATELVTLWARDGLIQRREGDPTTISAYRAGYLPEERRVIEKRLRSGLLRGVVATNALELGIDIGSLDAVILSGYPGTVISTWQQAGRAGRDGRDSLAIMVGSRNPLDQYFMRHPDALFRAPHEHAIIDLANPYILTGQLLCAAAELPIDPPVDRELFGPVLDEGVEAQAGCHLLSRTRRGWAYSGRRRPVELVSLGGAAQEGFRVVHDGVTIETMDRAQAYREAHTGAVLLHQGEKYLVKELDLERHLVRVEPADVDYYTRPLQTAEIEIISVLQEKWCGPVRLSFGDVLVTETYSAYKLIRGETVIGIEPLHLPPLTFCTKALWFVTPEEDCTLVDASGRDLAGGLHGVEHAMIATIPFHVMCDRWDLGGISTPYSPQTGGATIFVYDGYEGGIGLSEKAYALFGPVTATTFELVSECGCKEGCPACIYSPKCGNDNQPLDKAAAILLLGRLARSGGLSDETPATVRKTG